MELQELGLLYRQTAADLSAVINDPSSAQLAAYLNHLLARSHNLLYSGEKPSRTSVVSFYRDVYPGIFRETLPLTAAATAVFALGALVGWAVTLRDPGFAHRLLGPQMIDSISRRQMWTGSVVAIKPVASSFIATNNLSVAFSAFAMGITGVGTLWMMVFNGLLLGTVAAATWRAGMALSLWSFVAPHGVVEIPAICIAGGGGLEIARGVLFPGVLPRRESLARAGKRAVRLLLGTIPLLLIAGTIEGFFSPTPVPVSLKFLLAGVLFGTLLFYLFLSGPAKSATADSAP
ncbi:MAG: stage II sporulation protein M [Acidobacteriaceae bacterium]|nr:stage II sporulation protein M [Acidobacteriaceae bacterium]